MNSMNLLHLNYFYIVAREGGFTRASKILRIQQPAISRMVRQLEDSIGQPLIERVGRKMQLTSFGHEVFEHSQKIFGEVENLKGKLDSRHQNPGGPLPFAASEPIASYFVPEILKNLLSKAPEIYPQIYSGPASLLIERILKGELEFGLFFHIPDLPHRLEMKILKKVRFHLVVHKDYSKDLKVLESFIGSREIDDVSTRTFPTLAKLKRIYPKASIRISSNNLIAHRALVLKGLGVSVLPDFLIDDDLRSKEIVDILPNDKLEFDLKLVQRRTGVTTSNAQAFLNICSKK